MRFAEVLRGRVSASHEKPFHHPTAPRLYHHTGSDRTSTPLPLVTMWRSPTFQRPYGSRIQLRSARSKVYFSIVPRFLVALLAGGALAFHGCNIPAAPQKLLRQNPRRSGYFSRAQLAITLLSLSTVAVTAGEREIAGLAGGLVAVTLRCGTGKASNFAPMTPLGW